MSRTSGYMPLDLERDSAWPEELCPTDPHAGDEVLPDPAPYADLLRWYGPVLSEAEHADQDAAFIAAYRGILDGRLPWGAQAESAAALRITAERRHDLRGLHRRPALRVTDAFLSDVTEDWVPDAGMLAPERLLGPFADEPGLPRFLRRQATAAFSLAPVIPPAVRPAIRCVKSRPEPPLPVRQALLALLEAPPMLYLRQGSHLVPALPLGDRFRVTAPVADLPDAPAFLGRLLCDEAGGAWLAAAIPLPCAPPAGVLLRRLDLEHQRVRRFDRRLTWEDLLRDRSEVLYRTTFEWLWVHKWERWVTAAQTGSSDTSPWPACWRSPLPAERARASLASSPPPSTTAPSTFS
jgi:hypothetical protein